MSVQSLPNQQCPECGHATIGCVAGRCTNFVPGPENGPLAVHCDCDCYAAITGRSMHDDLVDALRLKSPEPEPQPTSITISQQ